MRFTQLDLKAFGPFTGTRLEFLAGPGLQIIVGPNEAGKSSALRAITALLFGIPMQTCDNFRHEYGALRVGAVLDLGGEERMAVMRKKGAKATLFEYEPDTGREFTDTPLPPEYFSDLLGGLDQESFLRDYGLDQNRLRAGGRELLQGQGELGQTLFQATGIVGVAKLLEDLQRSASELLGRGAKGRINTALREHDALGKRLKEAQTRPQHWKEKRQALETALAYQAHIEDELRELRAEEQRRVRLRATLPQIAEREQYAARFAELADAPLLDPEAGPRRIALENKLDAAENALRGAEGRIERYEQEAATLVIADEFLAAGPDIEALHHDLPRAASARRGLAETEVERRADEATLTALLRRLKLSGNLDSDSLAEVLPERTLLARVRALATDLASKATQLEKARGDVIDRERKLATAREKSDGLPPTRELSRLAATVETLALQGDIEATLRTIGSEVDGETRRLAEQCQALGVESTAQLRSLPIPLDAEVAEIAEALAKLQTTLSTVISDQSRIGGDLDACRAEMTGLAAAGAVVTWESVLAARQDRDTQWTELRNGYLTLTAIPSRPEPGDRPERYEAAVTEADRLADDLRADTQRATQYASLRTRCEQMEAALEQLRTKRQALQARQAGTETSWGERLAGLNLPALTPETFRAWLAERRLLLQRLDQLETRMDERRTTEAALQAVRTTLAAAYRDAGFEEFPDTVSFSVAMAMSRQAVNDNQTARNAREVAENDVRRLEAELRETRRLLAEAEAQHRKVQAEWGQAVTPLGLDGSATPAEVEVRIEDFEAVRATLESRDRRIQAIAAEQAWLDGHVALAARVASTLGQPEPDADTVAAFAEACQARLEEGRKALQRRNELAELLRQDREHRDSARAGKGDAEKQLAELVAAAGCADRHGLPEAERRSAQRRTAEAKIDEIERQLAAQWRLSLEALLEEAKGLIVADVEVQLSEIRMQSEALDRDRSAAQEAVAEARLALQAIDGEARAAEIREEMEGLVARIRGDAEQYLRVRLARGLLDRAIQAFQDRSRGPLIQKAEGFFAVLTGGRYPRLGVDFDDDRQVLVAERQDGAVLQVAALSEGTADQLYLALRLAAIELAMVSGRTVPVILDDVLMAFDDQRVGFALQALAELGRATQVLLFTHHRHVVDIARASLPAAGLGVAELAV